MTPSGIEAAIFQFVAQHLNHCATAVPALLYYWILFRQTLGNTLQYKVATLFNSHTSIADISRGITFSLVLNDGIYLRNILNCPRYGLFFA